MFARFNPLKWRSSTQALWVSFLLPLLIMTVYFGFRHMAPFGSSSILTVDLGQQYIDFFENFPDRKGDLMREIFVLSNCVLFLKHRQMFPEQFDQMRYLCQYLRMFEKYNVNMQSFEYS